MSGLSGLVFMDLKCIHSKSSHIDSVWKTVVCYTSLLQNDDVAGAGGG